MCVCILQIVLVIYCYFIEWCIANHLKVNYKGCILSVVLKGGLKSYVSVVPQTETTTTTTFGEEEDWGSDDGMLYLIYFKIYFPEHILIFPHIFCYSFLIKI